MPHPVPNSFTSYHLTEDEQRQAEQLSSLTVANIHNLRSNIAQEKLTLTFTNQQDFIQQEAFLRGQLDILTYLLDCNENSQQFHHIITNTTQE